MKGWYGNKQKHSLASKGVKTINIQILPESEELIKIQNEKLIPLNDKEKERMMFLFENSPVEKELIDFSLIEKGWLQEYKNEIIPSDLVYTDREKKVYSYEKEKKDYWKDKGSKKSTLQLRKEILYLENKIERLDNNLRKVRRGIKSPEEIGFENISKKDVMLELEFEVANIKSDLRLSKLELKLNTERMKSISMKNTEISKTINNIDKYHNRRK